MEEKTEIGIVCSHPRETRGAVSILKNVESKQFSLFPGYTGDCGGRKCVVIESGMGADRAFIAAKQLVPIFHPDLIVDFGVAAGLSPSLEPGRVILSGKVKDVSTFLKDWEREDPFFSSLPRLPEEYPLEEVDTPEEWMERIGRSGDMTPAVIGCSDFFLRSAIVREALLARGVEAFDFESFSVMKASEEAGIPSLCIRGISDRGDESAPGEFKSNLSRAITAAAGALKGIISVI